jgi:Flp pilus assembly protein TadG
MISPLQLTQGVEWVWLVWLVGVTVLLKMAAQALRLWRRPCWAELLRGEEGVSYSLSFVLLLPFYLLFVCLVFEATWLLLAKVGTLYAAHAGARSAVVWSSARTLPGDQSSNHINQSVWTAMTPFSSGQPSQQGAPAGADAQGDQYAAAYQSYSQASGDPYAQVAPARMKQRYLSAASRTTWQVNIDQSRPDGDVTVRVTYRAPLYIPGAARALGMGNEYPITSSATIPNEAPANDSRSLGIDYRSR